MASKILKGLAIAAGTGLAIGFGGKRHTQANWMSDSSDDKILAIEPLLDRLDRIESRVSAVEARAIPNIETLQAQLQAQMDRRFAEIDKEIPAIFESLHAEMRESVQTTLTSFEQMLDNKVSLRIATLEKALIDQSAVVTTLSQRAIEAEENFQRLIAAVERLCERNERPALDLPFERQLSEAFQRQPAPSGFRPRIIKEEDEKQRHRKPLARL